MSNFFFFLKHVYTDSNPNFNMILPTVFDGI